MKNTLKLAGLIVLASSIVTSCSIEKRHYMSGYHIEWKNNHKTNGTADKEEKAVNEVKANVAAETEITVANDVVEFTQVENNVTPTQNVSDNVQQATETNVAPVKFTQQNIAQNIVSKSENNIVKQSVIRKAERMMKKHASKPMTPSRGVLFVLAFFIPWLAVGLATDWGMEVVWNLLWSLTCIGGIIHAFIIVNREA